MSATLFRRVPHFESLESRRVLAASSVSVFDGVLTIDGTNKNDRIVVGLTGELGDQLSVQVNKTTTVVPLVATQGQTSTPLTEIHINALNGNDRVIVGAGVMVNVVIDAGKGNDWSWGGGGNDTILAGDGNDHSYGGGGDDTLDSGKGNDWSWGGAGNDHMFGYDGHDHMFGGDGDDELWGGNGFDHLHGDAGNDVAHGEAGHDLIYGGDGDDELHGEDGHDLVYGEAGNDWLYGDAGRDKLWGGLDDDNIKGGLGDDHLNGGLGVNLLDGDEGFNHLWNGTEYDFENPPVPPEPPQPPQPPESTPQYVTDLSNGTVSAHIVYKKTAVDGGFDETLEISVQGFAGGEDVPLIFGGMVLDVLTADGAGQASVTFSTVVDLPGETAFPDGFTLADGEDICIGSLDGFLNLSVAS